MFEEIIANAKNQLAAFEDAMHVLHTELEKLRRERDEALADGEKAANARIEQMVQEADAEPLSEADIDRSMEIIGDMSAKETIEKLRNQLIWRLNEDGPPKYVQGKAGEREINTLVTAAEVQGLADALDATRQNLREVATRCEKLEQLVQTLRRAEKRCSRYEEKFYDALATRWPAAWKPAAEKMERAREAVDTARNALFEAVDDKP